MTSFLRQPKHIVRGLWRSPMFTGIALLTLAVGIGANTAIFSVLSGILLKPLPFPDPDRLVAVWHTPPPSFGIKELEMSPATYFNYREEGRAFQDIGLWRRGSVSVTGLAEPEQVSSLGVTDGTLPVLGMPPALGRWFTRKDDSPGSPETVMLSYGYWQRKFAADRGILGRRLLLDGRLREIIGVMPRAFHFMNFDPAVILPFRIDRNKVFIGNFSYQAVARLNPGVTLADANTDVARMVPMMWAKFRPAPGMSGVFLRLDPNLRLLKSDLVGDIGKILWVLMGTVGIVLLIACANVANLLLVRADGRQRELAIRAALGAGRWQVARELLLESLMLGLAGGVFALALASAAIRLVVAKAPSNLPRLTEIAIDPPVLLFTLGISLLAGLLFSIIPVFKYAGPRLETALRQGGRTSSDGRERHRARSLLVVVQVALALVLLISSGLMIRTIQALKEVQPGFTRPTEILTFRASIPEALVRDGEQVARMQNEILRKIEAIPGVSSAGLVNSITMDGNTNNDPVYAEDHVYAASQIPALRRYKFISPGFLRTLGNPLLAGRDLTWIDIDQKRPFALVSESLAREYWGSAAAALGKRIRENPHGTWREIIGVAGDERDDGVNKKAPLIMYWPMMVKDLWGEALSVQRNAAFAIRSSRTGSAGFLKEAEQAVWSVNPSLTIAQVRTVQEIYDRSMARTSFTLVMLTIAAGMALLLGVVGIYGVIAYSVSQRTREIGIRIALGAGHAAVRRMFVGDALKLAAIGCACGLAAAAGMSKLMSALLYGVSPVDPGTYGAVTAVLAAAALLASYLPARRATAIEPVVALRAE